jgi:hypothetical protein
MINTPQSFHNMYLLFFIRLSRAIIGSPFRVKSWNDAYCGFALALFQISHENYRNPNGKGLDGVEVSRVKGRSSFSMAISFFWDAGAKRSRCLWIENRSDRSRVSLPALNELRSAIGNPILRTYPKIPRTERVSRIKTSSQAIFGQVLKQYTNINLSPAETSLTMFVDWNP